MGRLVKYTRKKQPYAFVKSDPDSFWVLKDSKGRSLKFFKNKSKKLF